MRLRVTVLVLGGIALASSCAKVPPPRQDEIYARDQWAALVTEADRHTVFDEANIHTSWSEKRKVLYELNRFQHMARSEDLKARAATRRAATRATTHPATHPTTHATTHATTQHTSTHTTTYPTTHKRRATTSPGDAEE